ncbi:S-layer homology domain-containing protein [Paenibacillus sp. p3-SID867]|uniref:RCC1 domain-containing protein n=1 Tax=Paenibacillus sp. p3-SID867 TaxID=2916363 RepID=UPI0021A4C95E|nr:S-layer homology domain-containing protein [Paenibacillus sp. p3-SID867]MCT1400347.1 S-layer homology domain-containing protein [Paenibacillus sp. p3-SID867]
MMIKRSGKILLCIALLLMQMDGVFGYRQAFAATAVAPKLVAGYYHTVSLVSSGEVYSWGYGDRGQLGDGSWNTRIAPVMAKNLNHVIDIHSGVRSSMALRQDGTVWTWGANENGQLGIGTTTNVNAPVQVAGLSGIKAISGGLGYHGMALTENGSVWTWGKNDNGELGNGTRIQQNAPVLVNGLSDVTAIAAGGYYSLALKSNGTVWAWGVNGSGELGDGTTTDRYVPVQVDGLTDVIAIAAGGSHSLAVKQDGTVWAWGKNTYGMLGDGTRTNRTKPVQVRNLEHIVAIAGGGYHSLAVDRAGNVWSWGDNSQKQLGLGSNVSALIPVSVSGIEHVREISAGGFHSVAMKKDGSVWAWGSNAGGQIGDGTYNNTRDIPTLSKAVLDTTSPDTGSGILNPYSITADSVGLEWPKASDNMTEQHELQYLLYISGRPNVGDVSQMERNGMPVGSYAADQTGLVVNGLTEGTDYYFNVIAKDAVGRKSAYRMLKVTTNWPQIYSLTYDGNGHTAGNVPVSSGLFARGDETVVAGNTGQLGKDGYTFVGWNTKADGSGIDYPAGGKLTFGTQDVTLYAKWSKNPASIELTAVSYTPAHQSVGVESDATLQIVFNEDVMAVSGKSITIRQAADQRVVESFDAADAGKVAILGNAVTLDPLADFDYGKSYYVEIESGAFAGNHSGTYFSGIQGADTWSFTVREPAAPAYDATLQALALNSPGGEVGLSPAFNRYHYDYKAQVANENDRLTVTAQVYDARVQVTVSVYGEAGDLEVGPINILSGQKSPELPVSVGNHVIEVVVTAPDGQHLKYKAMVTRASSTGGGTPEEPGGGSSPGGTGSSSEYANSGASGSATPSENKLNVRVTLNDESQEGMVTGLFHETDGHTVVSMKLDTAKLEARLRTVEYNPVIVIALAQPADHVSLEISGAAINHLDAKQGAIEIRSVLGTFRVPAAVMASSRWKQSGSLDQPIAADPMLVTLTMAASNAAKVKAVQKAALQSGITLVGLPVDFEITAKVHDQSLQLDPFQQYVEHRISWPQGMSGPMTTAVGLDENGNFYHIPTRIEMKKDGSSEAVLHRLAAGTVAFVYHQASVADVSFHWSKDAVNDLASRMILNGNGFVDAVAGTSTNQSAALHFAPNAQVNRAEFAAMIVRALGLPEAKGEVPAFQDVGAGDWYSAVVAQAGQYELLQGYEDSRFRPAQGITRQEAMAVMGRVMELAGLTTAMNEMESAAVLSSFKDREDLSPWARPAAAALVKLGIIHGSYEDLMPLQGLSRGEAAAMLQRLLRAAELID